MLWEEDVGYQDLRRKAFVKDIVSPGGSSMDLFRIDMARTQIVTNFVMRSL
jgi:hypothetical protein